MCTLGGDGTLIRSAASFGGPMPPVLTFSMGSVGYLTQFGENSDISILFFADF